MSSEREDELGKDEPGIVTAQAKCIGPSLRSG